MLREEPNDRFLRYSLAMEYRKEENHVRSLELFDQLASETPAYVPAFFMAGQQCVQMGEVERARTICAMASKRLVRKGITTPLLRCPNFFPAWSGWRVMASEKSDAIVLKVVAWSETSSIVTLLTRDFGRISAVAKGRDDSRVRSSLLLTFLPSVA